MDHGVQAGVPDLRVPDCSNNACFCHDTAGCHDVRVPKEQETGEGQGDRGQPVKRRMVWRKKRMKEKERN